MPAPIDYVSPLLSAATVNPMQSFSQGLQVGNQMVDNQRAAVADQRQGLVFAQAQQDRTAAIEAAKAQAIAQAQKAVTYADDLAAYRANPTQQAAIDFSIAHPEATDMAVKQHKMLGEAVQARRLDQSTRTKALLMSGQKHTAVDRLMRDALALDDSDPKEAEALRQMATDIDNDPGDALAQANLYLAKIMGPEKFAATYKDFEESPAVVAKLKEDAKIAETEATFAADKAVEALALSAAQRFRYEAQTKNEADRLGLDRQKLCEETAARLALVTNPQMTPADRNAAADAALAASAAKMGAAKASALADKFAGFDKKKDFTDTGLHGAAGEAINKARGKPGEFTKDRQAYAVLVDDDIQTRAKESGNKLTDTDYAEQRKLYPDPTGDFVLVEQWLRRKAQADENKAANEGARVDWMNANANMAPARAAIKVQGVDVAPGETFGQFIERRDAQADLPGKIAEMRARGMTPEQIKAALGGK